jgi:nitrogen fixation NifU-like protein
MTDQIYREIILEHYKNPQNYGIIADADVAVTEFNPLCGDEIRLSVKFKHNRISDIAFESKGCAISKASASLYTEEVKGKSLTEINALTEEDVLALLEVQLTPARSKCALLIYRTLRGAINQRR